MKTGVIYCSGDMTIEQAVRLMIKHHIGTLPITDTQKRLVGLCKLRDLIIKIMPEFVHMVENVDFIADFGAIESKRIDPEILALTVDQVMGEPFAVDAEAGLVRAIAILKEHDLTDLPVVDEEMRLVGIASYVDIGVLLLSSWINESVRD
jgi:CBS-domain-containing membrane protein